MAEGLKQRIESFDWLRGVAVLFMIQCHTIMFLLEPPLKDAWLYRVLLKLDGLVAPSFIFSAGFSLALVQVRGAAQPVKRAKKTARRLLEVLAVATGVNWLWFPVFREPRWLLRIDILHCIGLSLLIALPLMVALARWPLVLQWVTLGLGAAAFAVTPLARDVGGWPSLFLNGSSGAQFPLLPWAGYVYLGASAGATAAAGAVRPLVKWLVVLLLLGAAFGFGFQLDHPKRVVWVMCFVLGFLWLEHRAPKLTTTLPFKVVVTLGTSSLAAYSLHEMMLFYGRWWAFAAAILAAGWLVRRREPLWALVPLAIAPIVAHNAWRVPLVAMADFFRDRAGWGTYGVLFALLLGATYGLVVVTDRVYRAVDARLAGPRQA
jgi:uncharacterized membrane protein